MGITIKNPRQDLTNLKVVYQCPSPRMSTREFEQLKRRYHFNGSEIVAVYIRGEMVEVHFKPPGEVYVIGEKLRRSIDPYGGNVILWAGRNPEIAKRVRKK